MNTLSPRRLHQITSLDSRALLARVRELAASDRALTLDLLLHLDEVLRRGLYRDAGYSRMVKYCTGELGMSEWLAYKRLTAARLGRRFPEILTRLADGSVHLDAIQLLSRHIRAANVHELLEAAAHKTSRQVKQLIAERFPLPDPPSVLVALPVAAPREPGLMLDAMGSAPETAKQMSRDLDAHPNHVTSACASEHECAPADQRETVTVRVPVPEHGRTEPTAPGRYVLQTTLSQETHDLLLRAQDLLAHVHDCRELEAVLNRALSDLVTKLEARKFGDTSTPRASKTSDNPRDVPASTRRAVAERDQKRCTFVNDRGQRCSETAMLEYDHIPTVARGGTATRDDMRLLCRAHNQLAAERTFGPAFIQARRDARAKRTDRVRERAPGYGAPARNAGACERRSHGLGREHEPRSGSRHSGAGSPLVRGDQRRSLSAALPRTAA